MLNVTSRQLEALERADTPRFVTLLQAHVREAYPKHAQYLGEAGIDTVVHDGIEQAGWAGFRSRGTVRLFIDLTLLLGRDFHRDPQLPWACELIDERAHFPDELARATRLHSAALDYLDAVSGPESEFIDRAQHRLLTESPAIFSGGSRQTFVADVCFRLERIWPEKMRRLDGSMRAALIDLGMRKALAHGIGTEPGAFLCIAIMLMLGSGFDHDPMAAWSHAVLASAYPAELKVAQLHVAAIDCLNRWCGSASERHV